MSKEVEVSKYFKDFKVSKIVFTFVFTGVHIKTGLHVSFKIDNSLTGIDFLYFETISKEVEKLNKKEKEDMFKEIIEVKIGILKQVKDLK